MKINDHFVGADSQSCAHIGVIGAGISAIASHETGKSLRARVCVYEIFGVFSIYGEGFAVHLFKCTGSDHDLPFR